MVLLHGAILCKRRVRMRGTCSDKVRRGTIDPPMQGDKIYIPGLPVRLRVYYAHAVDCSKALTPAQFVINARPGTEAINIYINN